MNAPEIQVSKASRYVERGMAEDHASEQHAYWLHFSVEPLLRAAVAHVHPALLADPRSDESLLAALRVGGYDNEKPIRSRPSGALLKLLGSLDVDRFGPDFARRIDVLIDARNVESHGEASPLDSLRPGWRDDFLRVATALCDFIGVALESVLGDGLATLAAQLTKRDERAVQAELESLVSEARSKGIGRIAPTGLTEATYTDGRVFRWDVPEFLEVLDALPERMRNRQPHQFVPALCKQIRDQALRLASDTDKAIGNVRASAELRQAIANTRLQRIILVLSLAAIIIAVVSLAVAKH